MSDHARATAKTTANIDELARRLEAAGVCCELDLAGTRVIRCGSGRPDFRLTFRNARALRVAPNESALGRAYISGDLDFDGDPLALLAVRDEIGTDAPLRQKALFVFQLFLRRPTSLNKPTLDQHYTLGDDFYLTFMDRRYRLYSQCIFRSGSDALEDAAEQKLEQMWDALQLRPGMRLLDIGGGWGGVTEYCAARGVAVTTLTLVDSSAQYIRRMLVDKGLDAEVVVGDFLDYDPAEPHDHAVMCGVIEHIPNYRRFCDRLAAALKPGGRLYLDASATRQKFDISSFTRRHTWPGVHSFLALQDLIEELLFHGFEVVQVRRETHDYELTITEWARRLDAARPEITSAWSDATYRSFQIYLWGGVHAFRTNRLQAYHVLAERGTDAGPRPNNLRRFASFLASLR